MRRSGYLLSGIALWFIASGTLSVYAQGTVDTPALDYVVKAYTNTLASTSLHIESVTQTQTTGGQQDQQGGASNTQQQTASYDVAKTQDAWNVSGSRVMKLTLPTGELDITIESIVVDGELYMQINGLPQQQGNSNGGNNAFSLPQGWFDATQMAANNQRVPGVGIGDARQLVLTLLDALNLPVTGQSVTALSELPADNIDGQSMRVFQLTLDPVVILQSDAAALLRGGLGGGFGGFAGFGGFGRGGQGQGGQGQGQGGNQPGQGGNFTPPGDGTPFPTRTPPNPADYQVTFAIYIGDQDQLIHRIYSVIAVAPSATDTSGAPQFARTTTTQTDFSKFNEPVTIAAPQITSS